jgi:hypothetical protein
MTIPDKLPPVRGNSGISQGFRLAYEALNSVRDCLISLRPMGSYNVDIHQTPAGTSYVGRAAGTTTTETEDGPRWA